MYSARFENAVTTMLEAHGLSRRKAGRDFEASHAFSVATIVADHGFEEDTVIAALLHDTLEDTDLDPAVIEQRFGVLVLDMVRDVSEPPMPRRWRDRKLSYIEQLRTSTRHGSRAVAAADKIHNLSKMTAGLRTHGTKYIRPFTAPVEDMILVEQKPPFAGRVASDFCILEKGRTVADGPIDELTDDYVRQHLAV